MSMWIEVPASDVGRGDTTSNGIVRYNETANEGPDKGKCVISVIGGKPIVARPDELVEVFR